MAALANMSAAELRAAAEAAEAAERARQEQQGAPDFRETAARLEQKLEQAVSLLSTQAEKIDRLEANLKASAQEINASSLHVARRRLTIQHLPRIMRHRAPLPHQNAHLTNPRRERIRLVLVAPRELAVLLHVRVSPIVIGNGVHRRNLDGR